MPLENLLITVKREIGGIKVDGVITETTQRTMRVTSNPVEDGINISDHVIEEPLRYSMTGIITDTPLGVAAISQLSGGVVDAVTGIFGSSDESNVTRSNQAYLQLVELMRQRQRITVSTTVQNYDDLIFETLSVNTDKSTANGIHFSASFVQVLFVELARQGIPPDNIEAQNDSAAYSDKQNSGFVGATPATAVEEESIRISVD